MIKYVILGIFYIPMIIGVCYIIFSGKTSTEIMNEMWGWK